MSYKMTFPLVLLVTFGLLYFPWRFEWQGNPEKGMDYWAANSYLGNWIFWGFPLLTIGVMLALYIWTKGSIEIVLLSLPLVNGVFAALTGVFPLPKGRSYRYVHDPKMAIKVGFIQIILAVISFALLLKLRSSP